MEDLPSRRQCRAPSSSDTATVLTLTWRLRISPRTKEDDYTLTDDAHRCGVVSRGGRDKWRERLVKGNWLAPETGRASVILLLRLWNYRITY